MTRTLPLARKPIQNFLAMALITVLLAFFPKEAFPDNSLYLPHIFNKFSSATGGRFCVDPPPEGPAVITCISTDMGPPGTEVTIEGRGFGWHHPSWNGVYISIPGVTGFTVQNLSWEENKIVVQIPDRPGGDCTWSRQCQVSISVHYEEGRWTNHVPFTITGLLPEPPEPPAFLTTDLSASVGDIIEIYAFGLSPIAANNLVSFNGVTAVALTYTNQPWPNHPKITVRVPPGATTGPVKLKRLDGMDQWSGAGAVGNFGIVPANIPTLSPGMESGGLLNPCNLPDRQEACSADGVLRKESWVLGGSGFNKLRPPDSPTPGGWPGPFSLAGALSLEISTPKSKITVKAFVQSDTALVVPMTTYPVNIFKDLQIGDTLTVRLTGMELTNRQIRTSAPLSLPYTRKPPYGTDVYYPSAYLADTDLSKGDFLCIHASGDHLLRAPGIWTGTLAFKYDRLAAKCFEMPQAGTFTLYNDTLGKSAQIRVLEEGAYAAEINVFSNTLAEDGVTLGFGGGRLVIPPGALPLHDGSGAYGIRAFHRASTATPYDAEQFDGGHQFGITFYPVPTQLLQPVTIVFPYIDTGRFSPPQFGFYDSQVNLYYAVDGSIDQAAHRLNLTLPAGQYGPGSGLSSATSHENPVPLADPILKGLPILTAVAISGLTALAVAGAVSWATDVRSISNNHFVVDYVNSSWSPSFSTEDYAQEVLDTLENIYNRMVIQEHWNWPTSGKRYFSVRWCFGNPGCTTSGKTINVLGGDPWVYIAPGLIRGSGNQLRSTVAHEFGHYLQRRYNVWSSLFGSSWLDEATANWVAYHALNGQVEIFEDYPENGLGFIIKGFPKSFFSLYNESEAYAAGTFFIWLANQYGAQVVRNLWYELGQLPLTDTDPDAYELIEKVTGQTMEEIIRMFSLDYWGQTFTPVDSFKLPWVVNHIDGWDDMNENRIPGVLGSFGIAVNAIGSFSTTIANRTAVARANGLSDGQIVRVYGVTQTENFPPTPGSQTFLADLDQQNPGVVIAPFNSHPWYRMIIVNASRSEPPNSVTLELMVPHISQIFPSAGSRNGGYPVGINGLGFGPRPGTVQVGNQTLTVNNGGILVWYNSSIDIRMPSGSPGDVTVRVVTAEGAQSDSATFTYN